LLLYTVMCPLFPYTTLFRSHASALMLFCSVVSAASARWISAVSCAAVAEFVVSEAISACRSDSSFTEYQVFVPSPLSWHTNTCSSVDYTAYLTSPLPTVDEH